MGAIAKGVTSLFGGRARRREQKAAGKELDANKAAYDDFQFQNHAAGIQAQQAAGQGYDAAQAQAATLGPAAQSEVAKLGDFQGYSAQGYSSQGYDAAQAQAAQADRVDLGEGTGRTNQFAALAVNTAAADRTAQESDQALAAALESGAVTGGGGATALAQAALKSKQGVADTISQQESQNEQLRAQGATSLQQENLAQRNLSRQSDISQSQFNTGLQQQTNLANVQAQNQASQFGAAAANQAAQFGAQAQNDAARFGANAANQFSLQQFSAQNQANQSNVGAQNQFAQAQFGASNQVGLANASAQNQAAAFGASAANQASLANQKTDLTAQQLRAQGAQAQEANQFGRVQSQYEIAAGRKAAADAARQQATGDLVGGIVGGIGAAASGGLFGTGKIATGIGKAFGG